MNHRLRIRYTTALGQCCFWGCILWLMIGHYACRPASESVTPTFVIDTLPPKITSLSIPGIPAQNIQIDQIRRQLIVTLPKDYAIGFSPVTLTMTPNAKLFRLLKLGVEFCSGTFYDPGFFGVTSEDFEYDNHEVIIIDELSKKRKKYRLQIRPEGEMAFADPNKVYEVRTDGKGDVIDSVAVFNYVDTTGFSGSQLVYTDTKTGEEFKGDIDGCTVFGKLYLGTPLGLPLGNYTMNIERKNGRRTTNNLFLKVLPGKFTYSGLQHLLTGPNSLTLQGNSLFEGKPAVLEIWHPRTGERFRTETFRYNRFGWFPEATVPTGLESGYYYSQLTYDGQTSDVQYALVLKNEKQPTISAILTDWANRNLAWIGLTEIAIKRGQKYWCSLAPSMHIKAGRNLQLYLQSVAEPSTAYAIPVQLPAYWSNSPPWKADDYPSYVIPSDAKPGKYMLRVQYVDKEGVQQVGDWLERDVTIQ